MTVRPAALLAAALLATAACRGAAPAPTRDVPGMIPEPGGRFWASRRGPLEDTGAYLGVGPFYLDATEVTVAAYAECVKARRCRPAGSQLVDVDVSKADRPGLEAQCNEDRFERADQPVNCVDWTDARDYCAFAGKRLPTEDEWEWAARNGGRGTPFPWGDQAPDDRACWSGGKGRGGEPLGQASTCAVGSRPSGDTAAGVKDLAGNVAEWTATGDFFKPDSRGRGGYPVKIVRGGGYRDTVAWRLGAEVRLKAAAERRSPDLGFRCARDP